MTFSTKYKIGDRVTIETTIVSIDDDDDNLPYQVDSGDKHSTGAWFSESMVRLVTPAEGGGRADSPLLGFASTAPPADDDDRGFDKWRVINDKSEVDQNIGRLEGALSMLQTEPVYALLVTVILDMLRTQQRQLREAIESTQK